MTSAIAVRDAFRIHRGGSAGTVALQGLSLDVADGEIVVVLGPSGSGKTTLLRVLAGFDFLSAGTATVLGTNLATIGAGARARFRAQNLGLLDQHYARALSPHLSAVHSVALTLELLGAGRAAARSAAAELLERVDLADRLEALPSALSGGEQQRVALCASLVHRPRLLLADEPAGELDAASAATVYALIAELVRERRASALVVSHDDAATGIADRLLYVRDGRVVEEQIRGRPRTLVVGEPGWIRIPDAFLDEIGGERRLRASMRGETLELASAGATPRARTPVVPARRREPATPRAVVAELRRVTKRFATAATAVLDDLSHEFDAGSFTAVVGRSGSGKTTLLHLLAGLEVPTAGDVFVQGEEIAGMSRAAVAALRRRSIALVTQEPGLVPYLSARENVALALQIRGAAGPVDDVAAGALATVGLATRAEQRADRLSAGERQRVAIARAVAVQAPILLADEPTARLDLGNARSIGELLSRLAHELGTAVICATHDRALIESADETMTIAARAEAATTDRSRAFTSR